MGQPAGPSQASVRRRANRLDASTGNHRVVFRRRNSPVMARKLGALQALADPTRRQIFERLRKSEATVNEIAREVPVTRPAVSQHLKVLKSAGLVRERREGQYRVYGVELRGLVELRRYLDELWVDVLSAYEDAAQKKTSERSSDDD